MTEPTITREQAAKDENGVYRYKDGTPRDGCNAPPPDNGELGIYTGKEAVVFEWFCDRGMQPPVTEEIEDLLNRLAAKSEWQTAVDLQPLAYKTMQEVMNRFVTWSGKYHKEGESTYTQVEAIILSALQAARGLE